ncbi:MAG: SOS response-associated peptidase [Candidatus Schekmanbacteria bacterium]|nr:SOS response-associated peptidase [Candidatus Schekmanbacteria bacterium]
MCGRFALVATPETVGRLFSVPDISALPPRYNIAPTQLIAVVRRLPNRPTPELAFLRWGLVPSWAKDDSGGSRMINARLESASEKPSFRAAFRRRRCLIPATGFFEWKTAGRLKQAHFIGSPDHDVIALAGLWERWRDAAGEPLETCTILTTNASGAIRELHDRMPVVVAAGSFVAWLDPLQQDREAILELLADSPPPRLEYFAVSPLVNNPANDVPACLEPAGSARGDARPGRGAEGPDGS